MEWSIENMECPSPALVDDRSRSLTVAALGLTVTSLLAVTPKGLGLPWRHTAAVIDLMAALPHSAVGLQIDPTNESS